MGFITYTTTTRMTILVILVLACLMSSTNANGNNKEVKNWGRGRWSFGTWPGGYNSTDCPFSGHQNRTHHGRRGPAKVVVGGSNHWNFGFNYSDWALNNGPFYLNDVLVFKYPRPVNGIGHSVYLLPDIWSYLNCDLSRAQRVASPTQGSSKNGFEFKLTKWQPYYFACGEHNGVHCNLGLMKFFVMPIFPSWNN